MFRFLACLLALGGAALLAAELPSPNLGKMTPKQFQNLWSDSLTGPKSHLRALTSPTAPAFAKTDACSIPLVEIKARANYRNPGVIHGPSGEFDAMGKPAGDSVCKNWPTR